MMDTNKITVVSGEPRSGTSLMMQTLKVLGVGIVGEEFPNIDRRLEMVNSMAEGEAKEEARQQMEKDNARNRKMNPRGFYEIPSVVMSGINVMKDEYKGKAIKIITNGLYRREQVNGQFVGTHPEFVDKIIFCLRDPRALAVSQQDLAGAIDVSVPSDEGDAGWVSLRQPVSPLRYITSVGSFIMWLSDRSNFDEFYSKVIFVEYIDMLVNPPLDAIIAHLGINVTPEQKQAAIDNIKPDLNRSFVFDDWAEKEQQSGWLAQKIYQCIKNCDYDEISIIKAEIEEYFNTMSKENTRWVDDAETWVEVNSKTYKMFINKPETARKMALDRHLRPTLCRFYSRSKEKTYTIDRSIDLGQLTRYMVDCSRDNILKTCEDCKHCWLMGSMRDGESLEGQRFRKQEK
jgi:hypothetical protein